MTMEPGKLLAVIPARSGSKGLPGKNVRPFAGLPLIAHSVLFAQMCPEITRCIISTDSPDIADVAKRFGADVPFMRQAELAQDETPLWPVLQHALSMVEAQASTRYDLLVLLDPTSPGREPSDISGALARLQQNPAADGIIGVSQPVFNPIWHCVVERDGWMADLIPEGANFDRRQAVPPVYRINGSVYIWRAEFVRTVAAASWRRQGKHLLYEIPELRAMSIDTADEFKQAELLVTSGLITFPWMNGGRVSCAR